MTTNTYEQILIDAAKKRTGNPITCRELQIGDRIVWGNGCAIVVSKPKISWGKCYIAVDFIDPKVIRSFPPNTEPVEEFTQRCEIYF